MVRRRKGPVDQREKARRVETAVLDENVGLGDVPGQQRTESRRHDQPLDRGGARRTDRHSIEGQPRPWEPAHREGADRHRLAERRRGLRFERGLDVVGAQLRPNRECRPDQNQEDQAERDGELARHGPIVS